MSEPIYAGVAERIGATIIDALVSLSVLFIVFVVGGDFTNASISISAALIWLALAFVEGRFGGTPGKLLIGLRVVRRDGLTSPIGFRLAMTRRVPDFLGVLPGIGQVFTIALGITSIVMVARDRAERRSPYDRISDTRVVITHRAARPSS